jgi:hypothetical protein
MNRVKGQAVPLALLLLRDDCDCGILVFASLLTSPGMGVIVNCQLSIIHSGAPAIRLKARTGLVVHFALKVLVIFGTFQGGFFFIL